jgi:hypothetical protein
VAVVEAVAEVVMVVDITTIVDRVAVVVAEVVTMDTTTIVEEEVEVGIMKDEEEEIMVEKEV